MSSVDRLNRRVAEAFYGRFKSLYAHQEEAIDKILDGKNLILSAGTGSGKTESVIAPLIDRYLLSQASADNVTIIYIAPTKALVNDIRKRLDLPSQTLGLQVGVRHADEDALKRKTKPHILITTPESLDVLLFRKDTALQSIRAVVVDEVHQFYNTQRGLHLSILLHRVESLIGSNLQFACLSATVVSLPHIRDFLLGSERACEYIRADTHREINSVIRILNSSEEFVSLIHQQVEPSATKLLIFANTRRECERLAVLLRQAQVLRDGVLTHYSSLSDTIRRNVEHEFSALPSAICISTSTLELGIDIGDIDMVILYGAPAGVESLLQRMGRSNRKGKIIQVACLVPETSTNPLEEALRFATLIDLAESGRMAARHPYRLYGAAAQQCLSMIGSVDGTYTRIAELATLTNHLFHLDRHVVEEILAELGTNGYLTPHGFKNRYGGAQRLYQIIDYRLIYGNLPLSSSEIPIIHDSVTLGYVPIDNILRLARGHVIQFAGRLWQILSLSAEEILVSPAHDRDMLVDLVYSGSKNRSSEFVIDEMWRLLHSPDALLKNVSRKTGMQLEAIVNRVQAVCQYNHIPVIALDTHTTAYMTFAGSVVNTAIGLWLSPMDFSADEFAVRLPHNIKWHIPREKDEFARILPELHQRIADEIDETIYQEMLPTHLKFDEQMQFWHCDETIDAILNRLAQSNLQSVTAETFATFLER